MQVLALDTYNGNRSAAESYRQITGLTAPMLQNASNGTDYAGARLEDIVVVDQTGTVRYWTNATSDVDYPKVNNMVDALLNQSPLITLSLRQLFFGSTLEVGQSKTVNLELSNTGAGSLDITGFTAPDGIVMEPSTLSIGVGESKTVQLTLTPTQTGTYSGTVVLQHGNQSVGTLSVPINTLTIEAGQIPTIALAQTSLALGEIEVGKNITQTMTITNTGQGPLNVTNIQSNANIDGVTFDETQFTVPASGSKDITITFMPQTEGSITGTIDVLSNDPANATISLTLSGSAVALPPSISLAQTDLAFGEIEVGKSSPQKFTITNGGPGSLTVSNIETTISGITLSETAFTVAAGASKEITITYAPQTEGNIAGNIDILSDDPTNAMISLSITGSSIIVPADPRTDFNGSGVVDFPDFLAFVQAFGTNDATFDLNGSGSVDFPDFLTFATNFGKTVAK